jgi:hypothetical protein
LLSSLFLLITFTHAVPTRQDVANSFDASGLNYPTSIDAFPPQLSAMIPVCHPLSGPDMPGVVGVGDPEHYCQLGFFATPNSKTCALSVFDLFCNLVGFNENVGIGKTFGLNSQLEYVVIATTSDTETAPVLWYAGRRFGPGDMEDQTNFACTKKNGGTYVSLSSGSTTLENLGGICTDFGSA